MKRGIFKKIALSVMFVFTFGIILSGCSSHSHNLSEWKTKTKATCTQDEILVKTCEGCNYELTAKGKKATGHNYEKTKVDPTLSQKGYTKNVCKNCGDTYNDSFTYLITFESITENFSILDSELPQISQRIYAEDEPFYGFSNTSKYKILGYRKYKSDGSYTSIILNEPFTENTIVTIVWDDLNSTTPPDDPIIPDPEEPEHTCSYSTQVINPTKTTAGYTLHSCSCGDSYKDNYKYLISFKSMIEEETSAQLPAISDVIYSEGQKFSGVDDTNDFSVKEYRVYTSSTNYTRIDSNHTFTNSTEVTIIWEQKEQDEFSELISIIKTVENISAQYNTEKSITKDPNLRTMQFFRTIKYGTTQSSNLNSAWNLICGNLEEDFVQYVYDNVESEEMKSKIQTIRTNETGNIYFNNPYTQEVVDFIHMMGVINAIGSGYVVPFFGKSGESRDLAGWAGDICDLVKNLKDYTGTELITQAKSKFNGLNSGFGNEDLSADLDAVLIMDYYSKMGTKSISGAIKDYYEQIIPELEETNTKIEEFTKIVLGNYTDFTTLKSAIKTSVEGNIFIKGISGVVSGLVETYDISFTDNAEQFDVVYTLFTNYLLGIEE